MTKKQKKPNKPIRQESIKAQPEHYLVRMSNRSCWRGIKLPFSDGVFTNYLKDADEFIEKHDVLFDQIIPAIEEKDTSWRLDQIGRHCHLVRGKAAEKVREVYENIVNSLEIVDQNADLGEQPIYSIGSVQGIRLFCTVQRDFIVDVLFIDYHHLIYPDKNFNDKDYKKYSYEPHRRRRQ